MKDKLLEEYLEFIGESKIFRYAKSTLYKNFETYLHEQGKDRKYSYKNKGKREYGWRNV